MGLCVVYLSDTVVAIHLCLTVMGYKPVEYPHIEYLPGGLRVDVQLKKNVA